MRQQGELHVFADSHRGEDLGDLEGAADAAAGKPPGRQAGHGSAAQGDLAGIGAKLAAEHIEAGGFARAIGADQGEHLAGMQGKGNVVHRADAAEGFAERVGFEDGRGHAPRISDRSLAAVPAIPPMIPWGKASTTRTMTPPRMSRQEPEAPRVVS